MYRVVFQQYGPVVLAPECNLEGIEYFTTDPSHIFLLESDEKSSLFFINPKGYIFSSYRLGHHPGLPSIVCVRIFLKVVPYMIKIKTLSFLSILLNLLKYSVL
jgi:hypothetical protein